MFGSAQIREMPAPNFSLCTIDIVLLSLSQDREKCKPKELLMFRDSIGSSAIVNDLRWGGAFGVDVDFVALGHVAVEYIKISDIEVRCWQESSFLSVISTGRLLIRMREKAERPGLNESHRAVGQQQRPAKGCGGRSVGRQHHAFSISQCQSRSYVIETM